MEKRSAEEKLRDAFVPMDDKNMRKFRRMLSAYRREEVNKAIAAIDPDDFYERRKAARAAIMGGRHGKR